MPLNEVVTLGKTRQWKFDGDDPAGGTRSSYVSVDGDDTNGNGSFQHPYATINAALAVATSTRNTIILMPGEHTITASLSMPLFDLFIVGMSGNPDTAQINAAASVTPLIDISPNTLTATTSYYFTNVAIDNGETSQVGIQVDNANAGKKILVYIDNCWFSDGGNSIDVDHDGASDAVRIYVNNNGREIEGNIAFDVGNASDKFLCRDATFGGTFITAGDNIAALFRFTNCLVPEGAWASNSGLTTQEIVALSCWSVTGTTYAALDTNELGAGGDFTETIV